MLCWMMSGPGVLVWVGLGSGWSSDVCSSDLDFCIQYLAMGRGHVTGHDNEVVDSNGGDAHEQELQCGGG